MDNRARTSPPDPTHSKVWSTRLRWTARFLFGLSLLIAGYTVWYRRAHPEVRQPVPLRKGPLVLDWSREPFADWKSEEDGVALRYPGRYDAVRGVGRFTSRKVAGGITQFDVVAFRSMEPRSVITVAAYEAPQPLSWEEWVALARAETAAPQPDPKAPAPFSSEFGGSDQVYRHLRQGELPVLAVSARGAVKYPMRGNETMELWHFESRLLARGSRAIRITTGVHADQYAGTRPGLEQVLGSFRWTPPAGTGESGP